MRYSLLVLLHLFAFISFAQINEAERVNESDIAEETKFLEATQFQLLSNYEDAITIYKGLLKTDKQNGVICFQLSRCYEAQEDYENAIKYGKKAVELEPSNAYFTMQLAESYEGQQDFSKTAETYFSFTEAAPKESFFYERAVYFFLQMKEYDSALDVLKKMDKQLGPNESISHQKFEIYSKLGEEKKAIKELIQLSEAFPTVLRYKTNLAQYYSQIGQSKKADKVYKEIAKMDPSFQQSKTSRSSSQALAGLSKDIPNSNISFDAKLGKIMAWFRTYMNEPKETLGKELISIGNQLVEVYPREPKAFALLGDIYFNTQQYEKAIEAYEKTLQINGSVFDVWYQMMVALKELNQYEKLKKASDDALLRFPNQGIAYLFHGYALNQLGETADALDILQEAMIFVGNNESLRRGLKTEMARAKFLSNDSESALKILNSEQIQTADSYELKGDIYNKQGNYPEAKAWWTKALSMEKDNDQLREKINKLNG